MNELEKNSKISDLTNLLLEKKSLYNEMLAHEKQFEEVKSIFVEIRELEKLIEETRAKEN